MPSPAGDKTLDIEKEAAGMMQQEKKSYKKSPLDPIFQRGRVIESDSSSRCFKIYIVIFMITIWATHTLLVRYTRSTVPVNLLYASSTVLLKREFFGKPLELAKMSVPSITYAVQNNLDFIALSNLEASIYQVSFIFFLVFKVTTQLKLISTAIFMMIFLGRRFSLRRWLAIFILFCGIAAVQVWFNFFLNVLVKVDKLNQDPILNMSDKASLKKSQENPITGLIAVLLSCLAAGFAGVWFEKMLKDGSTTPFWIRNLQMYFCGVITSGFACFLIDSNSIQKRVLLGIGGVFISLMMKHMDNLYKSFASSFSIILVVIASLWLFEQFEIGYLFALGSVAVCFAIVLYNSVNQ